MNRVVYRTTLDVLKGGVQKTLQGFHVGDNLGRLIVLTLTSGADTFELPENGITAIMYVTQEDGTQSINHCEIIDNVISYEVLPSDVPSEGIVKLQLKIIANNAHGIERVLFAPVFAIEVEEGYGTDSGIEYNPTFTALENALAMAQAAYSHTIVRIEFGEDHVFRVIYADGTMYESDEVKIAFDTCLECKESALDSKHIAMIEADRAVDSAKYVEDLHDEVMKHSIYTYFKVDFNTGHLMYESTNYKFDIDYDTGCLVWSAVGEETDGNS